MKIHEIDKGATYLYMHNGRTIKVTVTDVSGFKIPHERKRTRIMMTNLTTGRTLTARSAARFISKVAGE